MSCDRNEHDLNHSLLTPDSETPIFKTGLMIMGNPVTLERYFGHYLTRKTDSNRQVT